ncbi:hypothetical protein CGI62_23560 [Vibrio parahaemolyticus]|nr:hypothetical protein CGI62_23560 [Vibrio parahaemolyticus]
MCRTSSNKKLTKRLRRIPNAWHFWFDSAFVFTAQWFSSGGSVAHHLTRRYVLLRKIRNLWIKMLKFGVSTTKKHYLAHTQNVLSLQLVSMSQISK